jgi:hypothetical protein
MDVPGRTYEIRQIERSVARASPDIRNTPAPAQFRAVPASKHAMPPEVVLQRKALDFSVMGTNYVVTIFRCTHVVPPMISHMRRSEPRSLACQLATEVTRPSADRDPILAVESRDDTGTQAR